MSSPQITYSSRPDATREAELDALAAIYKLCISSHERKEAAISAVSRPDDAKGPNKNARASATNYT